MLRRRNEQASGNASGISTAIRLAFGLALIAPPALAAAQIDVSGRWHFVLSSSSFGITFERSLTLTQSGTRLTASAEYSGGSIDPLSGVLHLDGQGYCVDRFDPTDYTIVPWAIDGTASADGLTITGTFDETIQPTRSCLNNDGTFLAERLPDSCGNGTVDAGEACDGGATGSDCCTEFCTPRAAGISCTSDGNACSTDACDGSGGCAHTPSQAGTWCRIATEPCNHVEVCDGATTVCPAVADVDNDGVADACDDCLGRPLEASMVRLGRFAGTASAPVDFVQLRTRLRLAPGASLPDLAATWQLLSLYGQTTAGLFAIIPPGTWDPIRASGWRQRGAGWIFRSREPVDGVVSRMSVAPVRGDPTAYTVRIATPRASFVSAAPVPPLTLKVFLDGPPSTSCGEAHFGTATDPQPACGPLTRGGVLACR